MWFEAPSRRAWLSSRRRTRLSLMSRAVVLLVKNADGSETAAGIMQISGDDSSIAKPGGGYALGLSAAVSYSESLARQAREAGDSSKARLEAWVDWIIDELEDPGTQRAEEVPPTEKLTDLLVREITRHPAVGSPAER